MYSNKKDNKGIGDADWTNDVDNNNSITGCIFTKCNGPISWSKQRSYSSFYRRGRICIIVVCVSGSDIAIKVIKRNQVKVYNTNQSVL